MRRTSQCRQPSPPPPIRAAELQALVNSTPVILARCSRDLRYVFVNKAHAELFGLTPQQIVGKRVPDILGVAAYKALRPYVEEVLRGTPVEFEREIPYHGPGLRFMRVSYVPDKDEQGQVVGWYATIIDITEQKRAEAARWESEGRFRTMADAAPVLIWTAGLDKLCTHFNKPWLEFTGRTMAQELGNGWAEGVHPDDLQRCLKIYTSSFDARREFRMEYRLRRHDGQYRWLLDHGVPRFDGTNEFVGYIGSCVDITDRRQAEAALIEAHAQLERRVLKRTAELRESEETLEHLFRFAPDAIVVTDAGGRIVRVNRREETMFGYPAQELIGKSVEMLLPKRFRRQHVTQRAGYTAHPRVRLMGEGLVLMGLRKNGREFPVEITLAPLPGRDGRRTMAVIRDITKRHKAERALRASEARYRAILNYSPVVIFVKDLQGRYLDVNPEFERQFGLRRKQVIGRTAAELFSAPQAAVLCRNDQKAIQSGSGFQFEEVVQYPDGKHHRLVAKFPLRDGEGEIIGLAGIATDITDRRRLEEEFVKISERERRRIGHELHDTVGQTLTGLILMSSGLQRELEDRSQEGAALAGKIARYAEKAAGQAHNLARSLVPLELERAGLVPALRELASNVTGLYGIPCAFTGPGLIMEVDPVLAEQFFRIAQEAATNAAKHSRGTRIEIRLNHDHTSLTLTVRDNGVGLPEVAPKNKRMGLHILQHRANLIGATLEFGRGPRGGTVVTCRTPNGTVRPISS